MTYGNFQHMYVPCITRLQATKSIWSLEGSPKPSRAHAFGHLGFEVGEYVLSHTIIPLTHLPDIPNSWWLKPAAAYRDGIIDETSHGITADDKAAYAIVLTGSCETDLGRDQQIRYTASVNDPGMFRLTKTMLREDPEEKVVRVLRSWKLRSDIAPKAGLRYDGLSVPLLSQQPHSKPANTRDCYSYRILSFSVHLSPPDTWHTAFTLARISSQPSILPILQIPHSDQLDDWKDYQRLRLIDRGDDFEMLREILAHPQRAGEGDGISDGRHGSEDSGYFSRRSSKAVSVGGGMRDPMLVEELEELAEMIERKKDEAAEEAEDEGDGLDDEDDGQKGMTPNTNNNSHLATEISDTEHLTPFTQPAATPSHLHQVPPQSPIGTRFISPRKPAQPRLSADDAVVVGAEYKKAER